jgi:single-strand DNA-binding protein
MSNINTVTVSGNLTADPEIKMAGAEGDFAIVNLRMANNRSKLNKESGEYEDETSYFDVTVFGKFGELCDRKLRIGDALAVSGRLEQQRWETAEGDKRSKVVVIASDIDSPSFFKKVEDIKAKKDGDAPATGAPATAPADDDIPF